MIRETGRLVRRNTGPNNARWVVWALGEFFFFFFFPLFFLILTKVLRYDISELWETGGGVEMQAAEAAERNRSVSLHRVKTWPQLMCCALV